MGGRASIDGIAAAIAATEARDGMDGNLAVAIVHEVHTTRPYGGLTPRQLVAAEIGPALGLGSGAADKLLNHSLLLAERLPNTLGAVCAGQLSWHKATILAEATAPLTDEQTRLVEEQCLPKAAGRTPAQHADAVRRSVARIDPDGAAARRKQAKRDVKLIRSHYGDGMGDLFARMASEQLDTVWTAADMWARARKADGDPRTLDQLRVASLVQWAQSFMHHGDPSYCDRWCEPGSHGGPVADDGDGGDGDGGGDVEPTGDDDDAPPASVPPTRHGRPAALHAFWDLTSLLGLTRHCGELTDSGAMMPPDAMTELVAGGVQIRRMLIDPDSGHLVDLTPRTWWLPRTKPTEFDAPVVLGVVLTTDLWQAISDGSADPQLIAAIAAGPQAIRHMLDHALTADDLDAAPAAYPPPAQLAEFIAMRDRHPTNPGAGPTAASAADLEHVIPAGAGGTSTRVNLTYAVRRAHNLKTHGGWQVQRHGRGWLWTSPRGRSYYTEPYDYRLGP